MNFIKQIVIICSVLIAFSACQETVSNQPGDALDIEKEKLQIVASLNNETRSAFQRDYQAWSKYWVHNESVSKTYINFADSSFPESIGWDEISGFVKDFMDQHPEPEPVPELLKEIDVRLYDHGAWVVYEQQDSLRGLKREVRLMEKSDGQWKIAAMHTTIYGSK